MNDLIVATDRARHLYRLTGLPVFCREFGISRARTVCSGGPSASEFYADRIQLMYQRYLQYGQQAVATRFENDASEMHGLFNISIGYRA